MAEHLEQYIFPFKSRKQEIIISVESRDERGWAEEVGITEVYEDGRYREVTVSKRYWQACAGDIASGTLRMIVNKYGMKKLGRSGRNLAYAYVWLKKHVVLGLSEEQANEEFVELDDERIKQLAYLLRYNHYPQMVRDDWYCPKNVVRWFLRDIKNKLIRPFRRIGKRIA